MSFGYTTSEPPTGMLTEADFGAAEAMAAEAANFEREDTFFPAFQNCSVCNGFVYKKVSSVAEQLGACGCIVAYEMEVFGHSPTEQKHRLVRRWPVPLRACPARTPTRACDHPPATRPRSKETSAKFRPPTRSRTRAP